MLLYWQMLLCIPLRGIIFHFLFRWQAERWVVFVKEEPFHFVLTCFYLLEVFLAELFEFFWLFLQELQIALLLLELLHTLDLNVWGHERIESWGWSLIEFKVHLKQPIAFRVSDSKQNSDTKMKRLIFASKRMCWYDLTCHHSSYEVFFLTGRYEHTKTDKHGKHTGQCLCVRWIRGTMDKAAKLCVTFWIKRSCEHDLRHLTAEGDMKTPFWFPALHLMGLRWGKCSWIKLCINCYIYTENSKWDLQPG